MNHPQSTATQVSVLQLTLHGHTVGHLLGFKDGRTVLRFDNAFRHNFQRPTFSLITHPDFPTADAVMNTPWVKRQHLHPTLSNLLPEGALRELIARHLKVHVDNEFQLLAYLGHDLPGALIATPLAPEHTPEDILSLEGHTQTLTITPGIHNGGFSLAGVQMKFSMKAHDGRYTLNTNHQLGDWIIKTPSTLHPWVPLNEYSAMSLAAMAGVDIPAIRLVELKQLDGLPPINLPNETFAYAIQRYDRHQQQRIHAEDFAQVLVKYPHNKYDAASYGQIAHIIYHYSGNGLTDAQQMARRLLVNILLANGDAHLKNWSLIYPDQITPRLAPAYDILTTRVYIANEAQFALNLAKTKNWYSVTPDHFQHWAQKAQLPWRAIKPHLDDTLDRARTLWPQALKELPMHEDHKKQLVEHWRQLSNDFKISISI